jgi:Na+-translocating ferredoxin:NAD+ oxidoreductase RNF subunit RnfB
MRVKNMAGETTIGRVELRLEEGQCVGCAICADVCTHAAMRMGDDEIVPVWIARLCTGCRDCEKECPTAAIEISVH